MPFSPVQSCIVCDLHYRLTYDGIALPESCNLTGAIEVCMCVNGMSTLFFLSHKPNNVDLFMNSP